jgi:hypothetical protein
MLLTNPDTIEIPMRKKKKNEIFTVFVCKTFETEGIYMDEIIPIGVDKYKSIKFRYTFYSAADFFHTREEAERFVRNKYGPGEGNILFPDPSTNIVSIKASDITRVTVYDAMGLEVKAMIAYENTACSIHIGNLSEGLYDVHLTSLSGLSNHKMIVKH